ncbi:MAG: 3-hydroxyacyl-CoA dehydrogenase NAD-binding domain-containing protein [Planctomycetota bacterium]
MSEIKSLAVIGGGQMGGGIAQIAAGAGIGAIVFDSKATQLERCKATHEKLISRAVEKGRMEQSEADAALSRISYVADMNAIKEADWVVEAIVENAEVKEKVFAELAHLFQHRDEVALCSNTSSISITQLARAAEDTVAGTGKRVIGMHFFYPVPVMGLVEIIRGLETDESIATRTSALAEKLGKTPLVANDRAGFVSNRVLMPMINEAFYALMEGVAEPKAIDGIMKLGCNFPMGPLELADFIGLDTCVNIMDVLAEGLNNERYRACPVLKQYVVAGRLGKKSGAGVYEYGN